MDASNSKSKIVKTICFRFRPSITRSVTSKSADRRRDLIIDSTVSWNTDTPESLVSSASPHADAIATFCALLSRIHLNVPHFETWKCLRYRGKSIGSQADLFTNLSLTSAFGDKADIRASLTVPVLSGRPSNMSFGCYSPLVHTHYSMSSRLRYLGLQVS